MHSRAATGLRTRHNPLRGHLHITGLTDSALCRKRGPEDTRAHVLCDPEALATLAHTHLGYFLFGP
jgi:hypothetical protein